MGRSAFAEVLCTSFLQLALQPRGCRTMQALIESTSPEEQERLAYRLRHHVVRCAQHQHANYVLQKCIEHMLPQSLSFVASELQGQVHKLAQHESGCRVLQRMLEFWSERSWSQMKALTDEIVANAGQLSRHKYGNFVVQDLLQHGSPEDRQSVISMLRQDVLGYSKDRYSSRVVQKCFQMALPEQRSTATSERNALLRAVLGFRPGDYAVLIDLACHPYGNYVAQEAIARCPVSELSSLNSAFCRAGFSACGSSIHPRVFLAVEQATGVGFAHQEQDCNRAS